VSEKFTIVDVDHVGSSQGASVVYEGCHEIMQAGLEHWPEGLYPVDLNSPAILAIDAKAKDIVGILTYEQMDHRSYEVTLAYVEQTSRRQGAFRQMFEHLKFIGRKAGINRIVVDMSFGNAEMTHATYALKMAPKTKTHVLQF
jgi:hypothetical protein